MPRPTSAHRVLIPLLGLLGGVVFDASAQVFPKENPSLPTGDTGGDLGGFSVAVDRDTLVTGCPQNDTVPGPGKALVFIRSGEGTAWTKQGAGLFASDPQNLDQFGRAVAIDGDRVVVTAPSKANGTLVNSGAAYVFERSGATWTQTAKITPAVPFSELYFGFSVALQGNTLLVGAQRRPGPSGQQNAGAVFVYELVGGVWQEKTILFSPAPLVDAYFGDTLSFQGDRFVTGAIFDNGVVAKTGAAYVFHRTTPGDNSTWAIQQKLEAPADPNHPPAAKDEFGVGVSLDGNLIVVGAHQHDLNGIFDSGAAYVFEWNGSNWVYKGMLGPPIGQADSHFGVEVVVKSDLVAVAAHVEDIPDPGAPSQMLSDAGAAYLFKLVSGSFTQVAKVTPAAPHGGDIFGRAMALDGRTLISGARRFDGTAPTDIDIGAAYDFTLLESVFTPHGTGCPGSGGFVPSLTMSADAIAVGGAFVTLEVQNAVGPSTGLVLLGPQASVPTGNGCSLLVSPIMVSFSIPILGNGPGTGQVLVAAPIPPTTTVFQIGLQVLVGDPGAPQGYCATNGVVFAVQ